MSFLKTAVFIFSLSLINKTSRKGKSWKVKQSHLLKHALISNRPVVDLKDLKIIDKNYHGNKYKSKISEALYIKQYQPLLNAQEHSVHLKLFNWTVNFN